MKALAILIVTLALASVAAPQLTYDRIRIAVAPGVVCPTAWTAQTPTVVSEEEYYIHVPAILGGRSFLVSKNLADALWPSAAAKAAAVVQGIVEFEAEVSTTQNFCSLLPTP